MAYLTKPLIAYSNTFESLTIQNADACALTFTKKSAHITLMLTAITVHWLPIIYHIQLKILILVFKACHSSAPLYLSELIFPYVPMRTLRSSSGNLLAVPKFRLSSVGGRAFSISVLLIDCLPHFSVPCLLALLIWYIRLSQSALFV